MIELLFIVAVAFGYILPIIGVYAVKGFVWAVVAALLPFALKYFNGCISMILAVVWFVVCLSCAYTIVGGGVVITLLAWWWYLTSNGYITFE